MESWRAVFRGFVRVLPAVVGGDDYAARGLTALRDALLGDDAALLQGSTTCPPPLMCVQDWPVEAADPIGWLGWKSRERPKGSPAVTVGDVEQGFAALCFEVDTLCGDPARCRDFLNFWDDTPRGQARSMLIPEVRFALGEIADPLHTGGTFHDLPAPAVAERPF